MPPFGPRRLLTVAPMMLGCGDSMMCLLPLPYIARADTVPVAKKNATIDDRLALLVIGLTRFFSHVTYLVDIFLLIETNIHTQKKVNFPKLQTEGFCSPRIKRENLSSILGLITLQT